MAPLNVRIPEDLRQALEALGRRQQRTAGDLVRESVRQYLAREELRRIREELRPYAESSHCLTDEDVFKAVS